MTEPIVTDEVGTSKCEPSPATEKAIGSRKEKRKTAKKEKRKQLRKELAEKARQEEEARLNDPEEQRRIQLEEEREKERLERERKEFEEREGLFLEALARKEAEEKEEEERRKAIEEETNEIQAGHEKGSNEDDDWEYVENGPPEIIWQGNEIIVKKNKVRVKKKDVNQHKIKKDADRPTSNPLPPQSEAFANYQNAPAFSAQQLLENVAQQIPNFGTEQDKAHCPFHIKTGACRFGSRCSRVHFYPDRSCTLLMKNMYNGPGLAWEHDEGLEYTDEEVERCYEEFYEDVHTEFLKYGEIVNFKVCRNGAFHLRGNLYVHYKSLDSALMAFHSMNGRYFAGKQVKCEFVSVTRWKIAICGEYMKSRLKTCSRGTACNFIHCFRNPGGDYEWADWDKPPPRYWVDKMTALFGYIDEPEYEMEQENLKKLSGEQNRYRSRRSRSRENGSSYGRSSRSHYEEHDDQRSTHHHRLTSNDGRKQQRTLDERNYEERSSKTVPRRRTSDTDSDGDCLNLPKGRHNTAPDADMLDYDVGRRHHDIEIKYPSSHKRSSEIHDDSHRRPTNRDEDWSDLDKDRLTRHDKSRKYGRHRYDKIDYSEYHGGSSIHETDSDRDLSDSERKRGRHNGHVKRSSKHGKKVSEVHDSSYGRKGHVADMGEDWLHEDRDRDRHSRRKSSRSQKKVSEVHDDSTDNKVGTHDEYSNVSLLDEDRYRPEDRVNE